jgi:hypothetical protein
LNQSGYCYVRDFEVSIAFPGPAVADQFGLERRVRGVDEVVFAGVAAGTDESDDNPCTPGVPMPRLTHALGAALARWSRHGGTLQCRAAPADLFAFS